MSSLEHVDIYLNKRRVGRTYRSDGRLWTTVEFLYPRAPDRRRHAGECAHEEAEDGFAYGRTYEEHWPVRFCRDCGTIIAGRDARPPKRNRSAWTFAEEDVIAAKRAREWPRPGRPRTHRPPPDTPWPVAA